MKLPEGTFEALFPFHLQVGEQGQITQCGKSLRKACPELVLGMDFTAAFTPFRPPEAFDLAAMRTNPRTLYVIKENSTGLLLRGQIVAGEDGGFALLGSPWFSDSTELTERGLGVDDFAIHDPAIDLLHILRTQQMVTRDLKRLTEKLQGQRTRLKEANALLTEQEAEKRRLAMIAERTDNAVLLADPKGRTQWVNAGFTRLTGYTLEDIRNQVPGNFLQGPGTDPTTVAYMREQLQARKPFRAEVLNYHKSGRRYWVSFEVQPIFDDEGELLHFMAIENDTTAQRAASANLRAQFRVSQLLASASDFDHVAADLLAAMGRELAWDAGLLWTVEENTDELTVAARWHHAGAEINWDSPGVVPATLPADDALAGKAQREQNTVWNHDLSNPEASARIEALRDQGFQSGVACPIQIGERVLGAVELFGRLTEPEDHDREQVLSGIGSQIAQFIERTKSQQKLESRSRELAQLNAELEAASHAKDEFLASISHEIRTPLNGVIGAADSLQSGMLDTDQTEAVSTISASASHLHSLLNDVLDLSRIEAGHLELAPDPTDLSAMIEETARIFRPIARQKGLSFEVKESLPPDAGVMVDATRLRQVLVNLLGNAFKFTHSGGVRLDVNHRLESGQIHLDFFIADSGIGIPTNQVDQLFKPFQQLDSSRTKKFGGTGLGLVISRRLVELMEGEIKLEHQTGPGTVFRVSLDLPVASLPEESSSDTEPFSIQEPLLVVDDNPANARVLAMMTKRVGLQIHHCHNAIDAMAYCAEILPPVILMDLHMPDIDGIKATRLLREEVLSGATRHVPIIALTADVRPEIKKNCLEAGMDDFLAKPIRLPDLQRTLRKHLTATGHGRPAPNPTRPPQQPTAATPDLDTQLSDGIFGDQDDAEAHPELRSMFEELWHDLEPGLNEIATRQSDGDTPAGQKKCHSLRGIIANFGFAHAAEILSEMEYGEEAFKDPERLARVRASLLRGRMDLLTRYPFLKP